MRLLHGDCLEVLKTLGDNSVDSVVTDPPYELGFMGKHWDASGIAYNVDLWRECLRVLKPGGHLLAFSGSRTYHRMTCAIEDAGFEVRDQIMWVYGSGFPKSLDVSKAIDKANGKHERDLQPFGDYVKSCRMAKGWSLRQLDEAMGTNTAASWWEGRKSGVQPPGLEQYQKLKNVLGMDDRFDELIDWLEAEREVVGQKTSGIANKDDADRHTIGASKSVVVDITAPATDAARQWQGWGTALKPAHEPICVARKPLIGTVAENVLAHGTGALNIDGCRVGNGDDRINGGNPSYRESSAAFSMSNKSERPTGGRWPANLIHDGSEEVLAGFPHTKSGGFADGTVQKATNGNSKGRENVRVRDARDPDSGSAARFFASFAQDLDIYSAKAIINTWKNNASAAAHLLMPSNEAADFAQNLAAIRDNHADNQLKDVLERFTREMANALRLKDANAMLTTTNTVLKCLRVLLHTNTQKEIDNLASVAEIQKLIFITTTIQNLWNFVGYADNATFDTIATNLERGAKDYEIKLPKKFIYCAKASKKDRDAGLEGFEPRNNMRVNGPRESEEAKHATLRANTHPTVKPTDLMRYLCRLVTPPGGVVLDPFMGSGSTGKAATLEGFDFIGIEREAEYLAIADARIKFVANDNDEPQLGLAV